MSAAPEQIRPTRPGAVALLVLWGALLGGLTEIAVRLALKSAQAAVEPSFYWNPQAIWLSPLADFPLFLTAIAVVYVVTRRVRPAGAYAAALFVASFLAMLEVGLVSQRVHVVAQVMLFAGIAWQVARFARRHEPLVHRIVKASALVMLVVATGGAVLVNGLTKRAERARLDALPAAANDAPNVILLVLDTVRAIELGLYGYGRATSPNLDSLAQHATRFEHAYSAAPWTLPSHASMLSGHFPADLSTNWFSAYDGRYPLLAQRLSERGYATGGFVGNLVYLTRQWGLDRGFLHYRDQEVSLRGALAASTLTRRLVAFMNRYAHTYIDVQASRAPVVARDFLDWQAGLGQHPFFAFINFFDAHAPYAPPAPFDTMFIGRSTRYRNMTEFYRRGPEEISELHNAYDQAIAYTDASVASLLAELRRRGVLDHTYLIVTADHGEEFGDHGFMSHGMALYTQELHVPLVVFIPGDSVGRRVSEPVTLRDVAATVADLAGFQPGTFPGSSLARFWKPSVSAGDDSSLGSPLLAQVRGLSRLPKWYPVSHGSMHSIMLGRWHYIAQDGGRDELYDLVSDSLELHNLSASPAMADSLVRLRAALNAHTPR